MEKLKNYITEIELYIYLSLTPNKKQEEKLEELSKAYIKPAKEYIESVENFFNLFKHVFKTFYENLKDYIKRKG